VYSGSQPDSGGINRRPQCLACRHYFITFDQELPYGCRAFAFKSRLAPCLEVQSASQNECLRFEAKRPPAINTNQ